MGFYANTDVMKIRFTGNEHTQDPIEKLREYAAQCCPEYEQYDSHMMRLADEIEAAYMKLPVGADGVPIRPGDTVGYFTDGQLMHVQSVCEKGIYYRFSKGDVDDPLPTGDLCLVNPDTVEGIIAEAMSYACEPESPYSVNSKYVREYAERIRKVMEHERP